MNDLVKLDEVHISTATSSEQIKINIDKSRDLSIPAVFDMKEWREGKPVAVVGGGPSLKDTIEELKTFDTIIACGSVHDYLVENGVRPTYCVIVDPDPLVVTYLQNIYHIDNRCKYLVASQCDPSVFEYLKYNNIYIWHAGGNDSYFQPNEMVIGGGCTVGTRAIVLAMSFGYKNIHLFGMDTCLDETDEHHAYKFQNEEIETIGDIYEIALDNASGKKFKLAGYMLGQLFDLKNILATCASRLQLTVHGGGLIAHLFEIARKRQEELKNDHSNQPNGERDAPGTRSPRGHDD